MSYNGKLVTVFGGSGFVGRYVIRALAEKGYNVRAAMRRPNLAGHLQPMGAVGQIQPIQANLRYPESVEAAVQGADHVINLVAILAESGKQTFDAVQELGAKSVAQAAYNAGASLTHISAIGADEDSSSKYSRTKAAGEAAVHKIMPDAKILRPSIIFGQEDQFFNRFAKMAKLLPVLPLIGADTKFQPVYVADVAAAIVNAMEGAGTDGHIYELGGPEQKTFRELMHIMFEAIGLSRPIMNIPFPIASLQGRILGILPNAPITADQVELLKQDNVVSQQAVSDARTIQDLGVEPSTLASVLPSYLYVYRDKGQYAANKSS